MLTVSQVVTDPFEPQREDKVPELSTTIRVCGIWPRHRPLAEFWTPVGTSDRSHEFCAPSQDTLLGGTAKRVEFDYGSHFNVIDDSDLTDFICHHAWFEGDEVALPREDRVYLLGSLTGRTPKKRRRTQSWSDLVTPNVASSFPVETEQHELEPAGTGAD